MKDKKLKFESVLYKGVFYKNENKWEAGIGYNRKYIMLGHYKTEIDAAKAYDKAARKEYGEFAYLNFP